LKFTEDVDAGVFVRPAASLRELLRQGNFYLAKVGVEGSNPFARSNLPIREKCQKSGPFGPLFAFSGYLGLMGKGGLASAHFLFANSKSQ
jgi:hypothetical protein